MKLHLYNTLSREKEEIIPIKKGKIGLYACGPTVYDYAHIGNLRSYVIEDVLRRILEIDGYKVKHVVNITDVGHLTSDEDIGEDKILKGAKRENISVWDLVDRYTKAFQKDIKRLNILEPTVWCKASDHIKEQIALIKKLEKKGYTYRTDDGIYFDSTRFEDYGNLARLDIKGLEFGARVKKITGKKNPTDFALWKFSPKNEKRLMEWDSPWGIGFPGWHVECSAMSMKYLGNTFDIHCGGVDHIAVHHTNELAQSEAATGKKFVNYWLHHEHLLFDGKKMSKSEGNYAILQDLINKGYDPMSYRYLLLTTHYRSKINFTWQSMDSAQNFIKSFYEKVSVLGLPSKPNEIYLKKFLEAINDDLDTPKGLSIMQEMLKSDLPNDTKRATLNEFDKIFGLGIDKIEKVEFEMPENIKKIIDKRETARKNNDWKKSDELRDELKKLGYAVEDTDSGQKIKKI